MKLSVLIPTYNYDCLPLLIAICSQAEDLRLSTTKTDETRNAALQPEKDTAFDYEVLVGDDCSTDEALAARNKAFCDAHPRCRYIRQEKNSGQAHNRNTLAREARYPYLLLLDCDTLPATNHFLSDYIDVCNQAPAICGQLQNPPSVPEGCELRFRYEQQAEKHRPAAYRNAHPYDEFSAFNILLHKQLFQTVEFDERCKEYGYEDALFGLTLQERGITVKHVDIPLIHLGFDPNEVYLRKAETALRTLHKLGQPMQGRAHIHRATQQIKRLGLLPVTRLLHRLLSPLLRKNLTGRHPSVRLLQLYKLGYYASLK